MNVLEISVWWCQQNKFGDKHEIRSSYNAIHICPYNTIRIKMIKKLAFLTIRVTK